jgi:hypothetical protein
MKVIRITLLMTVFFALLVSSGCGDDSKIDKATAPDPDRGLLETGSTDLTLEFYVPANQGFDNVEKMEEAFVWGPSCLSACALPAIYFRIDTGEWPTSWDQVLSYMPLIPIDHVNGDPYIFADYNDLDGSAPANAIVASWSHEGPEIFISVPFADKVDSFKMDRLQFTKAMSSSLNVRGLDGEKGTMSNYPNLRFARLMESMSASLLTTYSMLHKRLPDTPEEYLEGFIINPDFDPGFDPDSTDNYAKFQVLVNQATGQSIFSWEAGLPRMTGKFPFTHGPMSQGGGEMFMPEKDDLDEFVVICTEAVFFE